MRTALTLGACWFVAPWLAHGAVCQVAAPVEMLNVLKDTHILSHSHPSLDVKAK